MPRAVSCPTNDELEAFSSAGLSATRRLAVEHHLDACQACGSRLASLILARRSGGPPAQEAPELDELAARSPSRYRLVRLLGSGGMGSVYEAIETQTLRTVALKLAREVDGPGNDAVRRRFFREARVAAFLEHPNLVPVFEISEFADGAPYYTQRLIQGRPLSEVIAQARDLPARLSLMRHLFEVCSAVAHAHGQGIVHRDLKSGNVIVGASGETWVIDWGLAHIASSSPLSHPDDRTAPAPRSEVLSSFSSDPKLTVLGSTVGTPAYMSPEQARGEPADARSDVWSLGVLLVELLAGRPPFPGLDSDEVLARLRARQWPDLPAAIRREAPPELVAITDRALSPVAVDRYPSAVELADDLNAWMVGGKVSAHRYSRAHQLERQVRAHPVVSIALVIALVMSAGWIVSLRAAEQRLRRQQASMFFNEGQLTSFRLQWDRAAVNYAAALSADPANLPARLALAIAGAHAPVPRWKAAVGSEARLLAFAGAEVVATAGGREATAVEFVTGAGLAKRSFAEPVVALVPCATGRLVVATASEIVVWEPRGDRVLFRAPTAAPARGLSVSGDCALAAVRSSSGLSILDLATGATTARLSGPEGSPEAALDAAFVAPARLFWATSTGLHELDDARQPMAGPRPAIALRKIAALSAGGQRLLVVQEGAQTTFDVSRPGALQALAEERILPLQRDQLSPDGRDKISLRSAQSVSIYVADTGLEYVRLAGSNIELRQLALSPDVQRLATLAVDGTVRTYDLEGARQHGGKRPPATAALAALDFSPAGDRLASGDQDGAVWFWDARTGEPTARPGRHPGPVRAVKFSPDGSLLASCGHDGVRLWPPGGGTGLPEAGPCLALAWPGSRPAALLEDGSLVLRGSDASWSLLHRSPEGPIRAIDASPDGKAIAFLHGASLSVLEVGSKTVRTRLAAGAGFTQVAWSPEGTRIAASGDQGDQTWDAATGAPLTDRLEVPGPGQPSSLALLPQTAGSLAPGAVVTAHRVSVLLRLAEETAPFLVVAMSSDADPISAARPSPDGRSLAVLNSRSGLRLFSLVASGQGDPLESVRRHYKYKFVLGDFARDEELLKPSAAAPTGR